MPCLYNIELDEYKKTHKARALVLSCIDYRFIDDMIFFLESRPRLSSKYDVSVLAGASLGYNQGEYKYWKRTFLDFVLLAIDLHHIKEILVFDHMDCGAYDIFYPGLELNSPEERCLHIKNIKKFRKRINKRFPELKCKGYLINYNGTIDRII